MYYVFCNMSWAETLYVGKGVLVRAFGLITRQSTSCCCDLPDFLLLVCHLYQRERNNNPFLYFDMSASGFVSPNSASKASIIWRPCTYLDSASFPYWEQPIWLWEEKAPCFRFSLALYLAVIARHGRVTIGLAEEFGFVPVLHMLEWLQAIRKPETRYSWLFRSGH